MKNFTYEEVNLMALYNTGNRERLIEVLTEMRSYLTWSEVELRDLTDSTLDKLAGMTDAEFDALELYHSRALRVYGRRKRQQMAVLYHPRPGHLDRCGRKQALHTH